MYHMVWRNPPGWRSRGHPCEEIRNKLRERAPNCPETLGR